MATIHKRKLRNGQVVWQLTHGTGSDRQRFVAGRTREEAQNVSVRSNSSSPCTVVPPRTTASSLSSDSTSNTSKQTVDPTVRRYVRVLKTFEECFRFAGPSRHRTCATAATGSSGRSIKRRRLEGGIARGPLRSTSSATSSCGWRRNAPGRRVGKTMPSSDGSDGSDALCESHSATSTTSCKCCTRSSVGPSPQSTDHESGLVVERFRTPSECCQNS